MEFIKKNIKLIIAFILGIIISGGIGAYATYNYFAKDIKYTKDGVEMSVEDALNDLYANKKETTNDTKTITENGTITLDKYYKNLNVNISSDEFCKYDKLDISVAEIDNYEYICGYKPKFVYIHYVQNSKDFYMWSENGTNFFWRAPLKYSDENSGDEYSAAFDVTSNFDVLDNGLKFVNWNNEGDYKLEIWTIK